MQLSQEWQGTRYLQYPSELLQVAGCTGQNGLLQYVAVPEQLATIVLCTFFQIS